MGGKVPIDYVPSVRRGVQEAMLGGAVAGFPIEDVVVTLYDGSSHDVDSSEIAFKIAASMAFKDGVKKADAHLLEPVMDVEVVVPEKYVGDVIGDLNSRRGNIVGVVNRPDAQVITAMVPLSEMFGYATKLRSVTQGRAIYSMEFSRYNELPESISGELGLLTRGTKKGANRQKVI